MRRSFSLLLLLLGSNALAQGGSAPGPDPLRPSGPVTVTADRAEWQDGGVMRYTGNVALVSDTLQLTGQTLELRQFDGGQYEAKIIGAPARLSHAAASGKDGRPLLPVSAEALNLGYDSRSSVVDLSGSARMQRGSDQISGEQIRYNALQRSIQAAGGKDGQVRIVIQPPAPAATENKNPP